MYIVTAQECAEEYERADGEKLFHFIWSNRIPGPYSDYREVKSGFFCDL
jgi:hypothetical protein